MMAAVLLLLLAIFGATHALQNPIVETKFGKVQGISTAEAHIFKAIPYAGPVDGVHRWKDPVFPQPWEGVFDATREGLGCPQVCDLPKPSFTCPIVQIENCLLLNVFTPLNATNLPVLVFFHGGEFVQGYSGSDLYDGRYFVSRTQTVVVTLNYRLGALGYLMYGTGDRAISGNFGIKDQRLALEWVKMNIASFGGNPNDVTISGQSAGAVSVAVHLTSIQSSGLFNKVIIESNPIGIPLKTVNEGEILGRKFAKALGCEIKNDYDCLYSKNIEEIANATKTVNSDIVDIFRLLEMFLQWTPVIDEAEIAAQPLRMILKGQFSDVPIMIGSTSQECVLFIYKSFLHPMNALSYDELLFGIFQLHYDTIQNLYPSGKGDQRMLTSILGTDETFNCPIRLVARSVSDQAAKVFPVYHYLYNHSLSFKDSWEPNYNFCKDYSCHSADLPFVFQTAGLVGYQYTSEELVMSNSIIDYWGNFIKTGNPNGNQTNLVEWPVYSSKNNWQSMKLKTPTNEIVSNYRKFYCDILDEIGYNI